MFKKILLGVGVAVLALLALGASGCETETDTATDPVATATEAPAVEPTVALTEEKSQLDAEIEYLTESSFLIAESVEISDDFQIWLREVSSAYGLGVVYPDTTGGESVLARMRDLARRIESLSVPPMLKEVHGFWMAADSEKIKSMESTIAGVAQNDVGLIDQGTVHIDEATRLTEEQGAALERVTLGQ